MKEQGSRAVHSPHVLDCITHSAAQTTRIGQRLGELLRPYDIVALFGEFGSGKTQLVKGVVQGLGSADLATSPSFVLINEYRAGPERKRLPIFHVDLYRIERAQELAGIGLEELYTTGGICLIEWAERTAGLLPEEHLVVRLNYLSDTKRSLRFEPRGAHYETLLADLKRIAFP